MSRLNINNEPMDSGLGDTLYVAFGKINDMTLELYATDATFSGDISAINSTIGSLQSQINGKAPIIHTHVVDDIIGLQDALNNLVSLSVYTGDMQSISSEILEINNILSGVTSSISTIEGDIININNELTGITSSVSTIEGDIITINNEISGVTESISTIEGELSGITDNISTIEDELSGVTESISTIEDDINIINNELSIISGSTNNYVRGWENDRDNGNAVTLGKGVGKLLLTSGSAAVVGIDTVFVTGEKYDSPSYRYQATVKLPDGTFKFIFMTTYTDDTNAVLDFVSDNPSGIGSTSEWNGPTGEYEFYSYLIPVASGEMSFASGPGALASGEASIAMGNNSEANGENSFASGADAQANGFGSVAMGSSTIANGQNSFAGGFYSEANGHQSVAMGLYNYANTLGEVGIGIFNEDIIGNGTSHTLTDRIFSVGIGADEFNRLDGLRLYKNGSMYLYPSELSSVTNGVAGFIKLDENSNLNIHDGSKWNQYVHLDTNGKIDSNQLPAITITDTFVVASQVEMLALTVQTGDVAVRTDLSKSFILKGTDSSVLADWQELLTPTDVVSQTITDGVLTKSPSENAVFDALAGKQDILTNPITGTGTINRISKFTASGTIGDSQIFDDGTNVGIGTTSPQAKLDVRAQGPFPSDIAFRVRNSTDTANFLVVNGAGDVYNNGANGITSNTFFGEDVGRNTIGYYNTAIGQSALYSNYGGYYNTAIGQSALYGNSEGYYNTAIGVMALNNSYGGNNNTAIGVMALSNNSFGSSNTSIGNYSLRNSNGDYNIGIGDNAGANLSSGDRNIFITNEGSTLGLSTGSDNIFIGSMNTGIDNGNGNVILGKVTGLSYMTNNNIIIADGSGNQRLKFNENGVMNLPTVPTTGSSSTDILVRNVNGDIETISTSAITSVNQIKITTSTSISSATLGASGHGQDGRNVIIANGASNINYTISSALTASFIKTGSGTVTFVQGSGRTLISMDGTAVLSGATGSRAAIVSDDTTDYLYITNY